MITLLKYNMERWQANLRLIREKGMFRTINITLTIEFSQEIYFLFVFFAYL